MQINRKTIIRYLIDAGGTLALLSETLNLEQKWQQCVQVGIVLSKEYTTFAIYKLARRAFHRLYLVPKLPVNVFLRFFLGAFPPKLSIFAELQFVLSSFDLSDADHRGVRGT